jgi:hypothetical protein
VQHANLDGTEATASSEDEGSPFIPMSVCASSLQHGWFVPNGIRFPFTPRA